jgi:RNA polymerase sigma-70 factor (family 1)
MTAYADHTDKQLFALISMGNQSAFKSLFYRYNTKVFFFTYHIVKQQTDAEELTQDVFLKLWTGRDALINIENPGNYLFVIAKNQALDKLEKNNNTKEREVLLAQRLPTLSNGTEESISYRESSDLVASAVQRLPEQQRLVYRLSKEEGLSRDEIATRLKVSPHTVKNHLGVAIHAIRQYLQKHGKLALFFLYFQAL